MNPTSWRRILLAALLAILPATAGAHPPDAGTLETVASFNPALLEMPESIEIDRHGNRYVSLSFSGELRKIEPDRTQSTLAVFPIGAPLSVCGVFLNAVGPVTLGPEGNLYVSVLACDPALRGVWKVTPDGETELLATTPLSGLPNGIAYHKGFLYVADTFLGVVWKVPASGGTAQVWSNHPLLTPAGPGLPGPNGVQIFHDELLVANTSRNTIVAIPFRPHGGPGTPRVYASSPGIGCDDFALDVLGRVYCTTAPGNTLVRINPHGGTQVLLTADDGLDIPTATIFGRAGRDRFDLYITNGAYSVLGPSNMTPSIMRLHLAIPGAPHDR